MKFITQHSDLGEEPIAKQVMDPRGRTYYYYFTIIKPTPNGLQ